MNFMVLSILTSWYFSWDRCSGYFTTWLGVFPVEIVVTGAMVRPALSTLESQTSESCMLLQSGR